MRTQRSAFTLMEVSIVVALIAIVAAIAYPVADSMFSHEKAKTAADAVRAKLANARSHAMNEGRPYKMAVVHNKGSYRIAPDSPSYWSGSGTGDQDSSKEALVSKDRLPHGIHFESGNSPGGSSDSGREDDSEGSEDWASYSDVATFNPDGTAAEDREITLHVEGSKPVVLKLRATTGTVTMDH